jgi:enamine deaminase RidA (YjgF/YER057c/UK114 family)
MPILDVTIVGEAALDAQALADEVGAILKTERAHTWVRVHRIARAEYAENADPNAPSPIFATLVLRALPDDRASIARALSEAIAKLADRPLDLVHFLFEPPAAGKIAFGAELVGGPPRHRASSGAKWEAIVGYSRAVRIGEHVWVTGTTSFGDRGEPFGEGDAYAQATRALGNIERALAQLGASMKHVVRTRMFVVDIDRDWQHIGRAHAEHFGEVRPATTMVEVRKLIEPWMLVEIEADAFVTTD